MRRISKIHLNNFKFFYGDNEISLNRKNLLLYGENGSGKSSIYWGLFTFLQSVFKSNDADIKKYFDLADPQNLVNRFTAAPAEGAIIVDLEDEHQSVLTKKISFNLINTKTDSVVKEIAQTSDFINYRLLSRIYDFSNRDQIDLFPLFEKEILVFINFTKEISPGNTNALDWWLFLKPGMQPRTVMRHPDYPRFKQRIVEFNEEFEAYLNNIIESANEYLQTKFKQELKLKLRYVPTSYDEFEPGSTTKRNHKTIPPKILLEVEYIHAGLTGGKEKVERPHSFLNEARLTTIALAIRFAILDEKYIEAAPKLLVLDDLLISLDMSNRDIVLDLVLQEFNDYQIVIMTHDRGFFNMVKRRLDSDGVLDKWGIKEIYRDENTQLIPIPFLPASVDYLDQAKKYLKLFDYATCANYLRKECERILKHLLPSNKTIKLSAEEGVKPLQLDTLIDNFKKSYEEFGGNFDDFKRLKEYKDLLLNPLSHDNIDTPIYKQELDAIINIVIQLRQLAFRNLIGVNEANPTIIHLSEIGHDGENWKYKIQLKENLRVFKLLNGTWMISNPNCDFIERVKLSDGTTDVVNAQIKLKQGHDKIRHFLRIKDTEAAKDLWEIVTDDQNRKLRDLLI